jgi:hypothetical protein
MGEGHSRPAGEYLAIALVSCATLLLEITFTRLLSVVLWYHFAFLTVSLAMLGVGAPGVWFAARPPQEAALRRSLLAAGAAVPLSLIGIVKLGAFLPLVEGTVRAAADVAPARVILTVVCTLVPLLALGVSVVLLLLRAQGPAFGRMYASDLTGAALGAALAVPLMHVLPTPTLMALCGFLPMIAAAVLLRPIPKSLAVLAAALVTLLAWGEPFHLRYTKLYTETDALWEEWTPTARLAIFPKPFLVDKPEYAFGWGMGRRFQAYTIDQHWLEQDGSAGTPLTRLDRPPSQMPHLVFDVTSLAHQVRPPQSVCVIGSGGGRDVLTALAVGATRVDAVEMNGGIVRALEGPFREFTGDVYHLPGVTPHVEEGRSFLSRSDRAWDLIQISLIDSWAATAAGAFALSESNLYTLEAVQLYLRRLTPRGVLSISRWTRVATGLEAPRLALLVKKALELEGVAEPERHILIAEGDAIATIVVSRQPFELADWQRLDEVCEERGFVRHWPIGPLTPERSPIAEVLASGPGAFAAMGLDLSPTTDDRPFFFHLVPVFGTVDPKVRSYFSQQESAVVLLRWLMAVVGIVTLALFLLPLASTRLFPRGAGAWRGSLYFAAIGAAFLLVEAVLIQKFILYLGHPSHATTVVLTAVLAGAGFGSFAAGRVSGGSIDRAKFALPVVVSALPFVLPALFSATLGWPLPGRIAVSLVVVLPVATLMGFAFPLGMTRFGEDRKPWFWAINGVTGVLAGVASLALAMAIGYTAVLGLGTAAYLLAAFLLPPRS